MSSGDDDDEYGKYGHDNEFEDRYEYVKQSANNMPSDEFLETLDKTVFKKFNALSKENQRAFIDSVDGNGLMVKELVDMLGIETENSTEAAMYAFGIGRLLDVERLKLYEIVNDKFNALSKEKQRGYFADRKKTDARLIFELGISPADDFERRIYRRAIVDLRTRQKESLEKEKERSKKGKIQSLLIACRDGDSETIKSILEEDASFSKTMTGTGKNLTQYLKSVGNEHLIHLVSK